jgi:hypothetical protein
MGPVTDVMTTPKWQAKVYSVEGTKYPDWTQDFRNPPWLKLGVEPTKYDGVGMAMGTSIPWTEIAEARGGIYDIENWHNMIAMRIMSKQVDRFGWLGTACANSNADLGFKGLFNYASRQTVAIGATADNDCTADSDVEYAHRQLLAAMETVYEDGRNIMVTTPAVCGETYIHETTQGISDYEKISRRYYGSGSYQGSTISFPKQVDAWYVTNELLNGSEAVATGRAMIMRQSRETMKWRVIYPLQNKPYQAKDFADDYKVVWFYAGMLQVYPINVKPIAVAYASASENVVTTAGSIFLRAGRVM